MPPDMEAQVMLRSKVGESPVELVPPSTGRLGFLSSLLLPASCLGTVLTRELICSFSMDVDINDVVC